MTLCYDHDYIQVVNSEQLYMCIQTRKIAVTDVVHEHSAIVYNIELPIQVHDFVYDIVQGYCNYDVCIYITPHVHTLSLGDGSIKCIQLLTHVVQ